MVKEKLEITLQKAQNYMKYIKWTKGKQVAVIVLIIAVIASLFLMSIGNKNEAEAITIQMQSYEEKIVAVGQLQLARETTLISEVSGEIQSINATDGDIISADSVIISINDSDQDFQLEQKKASYENIEAQYKNLVEFDYATAKEDLISLNSKKEQAKKSYEAAISLYKEGALSQIDYLEYKSAYDAAFAAWNTGKLKVQSLSEGGSLRSSAYSQLQSSRSSYDSALNDQKKYRITVPWNSILLKTYVFENDYVQPGDILADIGEAGSYHVIAELDEKYFPYLSEGMRASISLGNPGKSDETEGTVDVITPKINSDTGTFEVKIALPTEFPYQATDLTVNVEIIIMEKENAITIPEQYLMEKESSVYLFRNGKAIKTSVKYEGGPSSNLLITDGLKEGDIIIMPGASIQDGKSVKIDKGVGAS